ncbi:MAG: carboxymuconolactone decarboxylase family protein [Albidovulum sp.]|nr:carboxymuconolactone decarboxylase family protein [Albidovulum sp.]MDE0303970.1 carboxymuconolactone decarboxylase family protein [Albidovulum sp.]MDE0532478.1 carboxymuconolactone decarboxylase family protein [Albidovulum sp.]
MNRHPEITESDLTPEQRSVWDRIVAGPRGSVEGPLRVWLQSPALADRAQDLGQFARYDSSLPPRLSELAIIVTGRIWGAEFEWSQHAPLAAKAGIPQEAIKSISLGKRPNFTDPEMEVVFEFTVELQRDRAVSDSTFARASEILGMRGMVDLVGICGYYALISMTINVFDVPTDSEIRLPYIGISAADMFA